MADKSESIYAKLRNVQVELKAPKSQYNSFGKYSYRNQEDILEAVKPLCHKHGITLTVSDKIHVDKENTNHFYVEATATVYDDNGETIKVTASAREPEDKKGMDSAQVTGATSSYARKYALNGMFNIDDTKDADSGQPQQAQPKSTQSQQRPYQQPAQSKPIADVTANQPAMISDVQLKMIADTMKAKGYEDKETVVDILLTVTKSPSIQGITKLKADNLLVRLKDATKEEIDTAYNNIKNADNPYKDETAPTPEDMEGYKSDDI